MVNIVRFFHVAKIAFFAVHVALHDSHCIVIHVVQGLQPGSHEGIEGQSLLALNSPS